MVLVWVGVGFPISIFQHTVHILTRRPFEPAAFSTHLWGMFVLFHSLSNTESASIGLLGVGIWGKHKSEEVLAMNCLPSLTGESVFRVLPERTRPFLKVENNFKTL